jgi:L-amino acid N-acyltransferase YncA
MTAPLVVIAAVGILPITAVRHGAGTFAVPLAHRTSATEQSPASYVIRDADPARDAAACVAIYEPFVTDGAVSFEERAPTPDEFARRIEHVSRTHPWLVAEDGGRVVAFAYGCPHRERAAYRWAADVSVYVAPERQRLGLGRALYGELLPLLAGQGLHVACAGITLPNDASVALHESVGFRRVGVYRRIGFKQGAWWDVGWWEIELRGPEPPTEPTGPRRLGSS